MVSKDNLLGRLVALIGAFNDASWEALASKGLLRRARKDMEKGLAIEVVGESGSGVAVNVPPFQVLMPLTGPANATCTCPAPGICQHILAAGLYLQDHPSVSVEPKPLATPESIREEVSSITAQRLKDWAGAVDYRAGASFLEKNSLPPSIEYGETVLVRLMPSGVEARFLPGGGLNGMLVPRVNGKRVAVALLLVLRKSLGLEIAEAGVQQALIGVSGTPRTPKEIIASAQSVLENAIMVGLSHLSPVVADRLLTLAVSSQGANLPRVSLALRSLSDEVRSILQRDARADESRLFASAARVYASMEAIGKADEGSVPALVGVTRLQYVDVPEIELFGVGAYPWKTDSGYSGLTVLFWSNQSHEFLSWSEARPANQQFDPRQRFHAEGPWDGAQSPRQVASSHLKLRNARRTAGGRISGSTRTSALVLSATPPQAIDFGERLIALWNALHTYVRQKQPLGLRDSSPLDMVVVLEPRGFGARAFDSITQTFTWEVHDAAGQVLTLSLPFREWTKDAIRALEELAPPQELPWRVVVRLALRNEELAVEPISILRPGHDHAPVFHMSFDVLPQGMASTDSVQPAEPEETEAPFEEESTEPGEPFVPRRGYLFGVLGEINRRLEAIAEAGCQRGMEAHREWFSKSHRGAYASGLTTLAKVMEALARPSVAAARVVLRARFLTHLHIQASGRMV